MSVTVSFHHVPVTPKSLSYHNTGWHLPLYFFALSILYTSLMQLCSWLQISFECAILYCISFHCDRYCCSSCMPSSLTQYKLHISVDTFDYNHEANSKHIVLLFNVNTHKQNRKQIIKRHAAKCVYNRNIPTEKRAIVEYKMHTTCWY